MVLILKLMDLADDLQIEYAKERVMRNSRSSRSLCDGLRCSFLSGEWYMAYGNAQHGNGSVGKQSRLLV